MRTDLYGLVHKGQRYRLFAFAQELSRADVGDPIVREALAGAVHDLVELLTDHAANEERYIHPLLRGRAEGDGNGAAASSLELEHRELDARLAELVAIVEQGRWEELYRTAMRLIGEYLVHTDDEERVQAELLWPNYTDAELAPVLVRFRAERDPAADRHDLALVLPALNVLELTRLLRGLRAAPESVWHEHLELARSVLGEARWAEVNRALARS